MTEAEIQAFLMVARCGSISAAANRLYLTQPALSRRIQALEAEIGCSLFDRAPGQRTAQLTARGRAFLSVAEKWQDLWQETALLAQNTPPAVLKASSVLSFSMTFLPEICQDFLAKEPACQLSFWMNHSAEAYRKVEDGELDLAIVAIAQYSKTLQTVPMLTEPTVAVFSRPPRQEGPVSLDDLDPERELYLIWSSQFTDWHNYRYGTTRRPQLFTDDVALLLPMLKMRDSFAFAPLSVAQWLEKQGCCIRPVAEPVPERTLYYLAGRQGLSPHAQLFLDCTRARLETWQAENQAFFN